jgi:NitT/TauT family transport system substrate-binding protein
MKGASVLLSAAAAIAIAACGSTPGPATPAAESGPVTLRFGYFPNLTHATALVGSEKGLLAGALGPNVTLEAHTFNAGPDAVTALLSNSVDASFMGPNPALNAFTRSHGQAVRVIAGGTSGGALLVVKPAITSAADLKGKKIADPQLGGTQDVALRWYLQGKGFKTDSAGGGDVSILPQDSATTLTAFKQGLIDGAWLPEPWASRLIVEGGAKVLVDERDLWPGGRFVTTNLVVRTDFLKAHPATAKKLLEGLYQANDLLVTAPTDAQKVANDALAKITGKALAPGVVATAWSHLSFTLDPLAATLAVSAEHAQKVGLLEKVDLKGLYDLTLLNEVLAEHGKPPVQGL